MAKSSGLGDNLYIAGYDVSGDIQALSRIGGGPSPLDMTGINKSAFERLGGVRDGGIDMTTFYNPASVAPVGVHTVLSALSTADQNISYGRGTTLGDASACMVAKQANYDGTRGTDGSFIFSVQALANGYGLQWGRQLTAGLRTDTAATDGSAVDDATASSFGLQAFLQVFAFTGTSVTVTIQESSDNGADAYAAVVGGAFTAASAIGSQRIATANNLAVERYLRVATTGTFSSAIFAVTVIRNRTQVDF